MLPCFLHEWNGRRQLTLIGAGITDYLDPLFTPHCVGAILALVRQQLERWEDWDVCDWQDLASDSPLRTLGETAEEMPASYLDFEMPFEQYLALRPSDMRRSLRRDRRRSEAEGVKDAADPRLLDALIELHAARWAKEGQAGMIAANRSAEFLRDVSGRLETLGGLKIFTARLADEVAAIILAFAGERLSTAT